MLNKLRYLIALARERHFSRAADLCGISQASLSNGIRALEDMLGAVLVDRSGGFRGFTAEGERVLIWAHRIVGNVEAMRKEILNVGGGRDAQLRIGAIPSMIPLLTNITVPLLTRHPETCLTVLIRSSKIVLNMLHAHEIDVGLSYLTEEAKKDTICVPLERQQFVLVTTHSGPLGHAATVTWKQAADTPLCLFDRQSDYRQLIDDIFRGIGVQPRPHFEADNIQALIAWVRLGHLATIIPSNSVDLSGDGKPVKVVPVSEPDALYSICFVARKNTLRDSTTAAFLNEAARNLPSGMIERTDQNIKLLERLTPESTH